VVLLKIIENQNGNDVMSYKFYKIACTVVKDGLESIETIYHRIKYRQDFLETTRSLTDTEKS